MGSFWSIWYAGMLWLEMHFLTSTFFFFLLLKTEFKREARMLCGEMHLAAITKGQKRDNSSVNLSGSCSGNGKKVGASALEWRIFDSEWVSVNICWMNDWLVLHVRREESSIPLTLV